MIKTRLFATIAMIMTATVVFSQNNQLSDSIYSEAICKSLKYIQVNFPTKYMDIIVVNNDSILKDLDEDIYTSFVMNVEQKLSDRINNCDFDRDSDIDLPRRYRILQNISSKYSSTTIRSGIEVQFGKLHQDMFGCYVIVKKNEDNELYGEWTGTPKYPQAYYMFRFGLGGEINQINCWECWD